jgi:hypothetical protein
MMFVQLKVCSKQARASHGGVGANTSSHVGSVAGAGGTSSQGVGAAAARSSQGAGAGGRFSKGVAGSSQRC